VIVARFKKSGMSIVSRSDESVVELVLVRQPGWLPGLIRLYSGSDWNHVAFLTAEGKVVDLDRPGVLVHCAAEYTRFNKISPTGVVLPSEAFYCRLKELQSLNYRDWSNVLLVLKRFFNLRVYSLDDNSSNCVGFVLRILDWERELELLLVPGDFEHWGTSLWPEE